VNILTLIRMQRPFIVRNGFNYYFAVKDSVILLFSVLSVRFWYNFSSIRPVKLFGLGTVPFCKLNRLVRSRKSKTTNHIEEIKSEKQRKSLLNAPVGRTI